MILRLWVCLHGFVLCRVKLIEVREAWWCGQGKWWVWFLHGSLKWGREWGFLLILKNDFQSKRYFITRIFQLMVTPHLIIFLMFFNDHLSNDRSHMSLATYPTKMNPQWRQLVYVFAWLEFLSCSSFPVSSFLMVFPLLIGIWSHHTLIHP